MNKQRRNRIAEALELISQARDILEEVKERVPLVQLVRAAAS